MSGLDYGTKEEFNVDSKAK